LLPYRYEHENWHEETHAELDAIEADHEVLDHRAEETAALIEAGLGQEESENEKKGGEEEEEEDDEHRFAFSLDNPRQFRRELVRLYVFCSMLLPFLVVFLWSLRLSFSLSTTTVYLHSLTPHDTGLTIIFPSINQCSHYIQYRYSIYNRSKVGAVDSVMASFLGRESTLLSALGKKHDVTVVYGNDILYRKAPPACVIQFVATSVNDITSVTATTTGGSADLNDIDDGDDLKSTNQSEELLAKQTVFEFDGVEDNPFGYRSQLERLYALYVFCSVFLLPLPVCDVSLSLLSIYCSLLACSDTT
jgi:hypothetical protein